MSLLGKAFSREKAPEPVAKQTWQPPRRSADPNDDELPMAIEEDAGDRVALSTAKYLNGGKSDSRKRTMRRSGHEA